MVRAGVTTEFTPTPLTLKHQLAVKGRDFCAERKFDFVGLCYSKDKLKKELAKVDKLALSKYND